MRRTHDGTHMRRACILEPRARLRWVHTKYMNSISCVCCLRKHYVIISYEVVSVAQW